MFESLYSNRLKSYRLKPYETVVEFYEITKMPAVLYLPQKTYNLIINIELLSKNVKVQSQSQFILS